MESDDHMAWLLAETGRFADILRSGDVTRPVGACPGWTLRDLGSHLGGIHRWALGAVTDGRDGETPEGPAEPDALHAWYVAAAADLVEGLAGAGAASPCWTLAPPERVAFWMRRQALETLVHRWDAETSLGLVPELDAALCADGVDEVIAMFFPRQVRLGRQAPIRYAVRVRCGGRRWTVAGDGTDPYGTDPYGTDPHGTAAVTAEIAGPPAEALLLLWHRLDPEASEVRVSGDPAAVEEILHASLTP